MSLIRAIGVGGYADIANLSTLDQPLPDGDWDLIVHIAAAAFTTRRDEFAIGFREDHDN